MLVYFRQEYIESMKELIKRYEAAIELGISKSDYEFESGMACLLCKPIGVTERITCSVCPWMVIEGINCDTFSDNDGAAIYQTEDKAWQRERIEELKRWIEIYENSVGYNE